MRTARSKRPTVLGTEQREELEMVADGRRACSAWPCAPRLCCGRPRALVQAGNLAEDSSWPGGE